jgi:predicted AAA+ superfamily ATPase
VNTVKKRFNTTGVCVPRKHYMVDISNKLKKIEEMIENEEYFIINRPRQYGKTTTMFMLKKILIESHLVIDCSFEGIGDLIFQEEGIFSKEILKIFGESIERDFLRVCLKAVAWFHSQAQ